MRHRGKLIVVALMCSIGSHVGAQGVNPGGMDVHNDPRQPRSSDQQTSDQRTTGDVLRELGLKMAPSESTAPSTPQWSGDPVGQLLLAIGDDDVAEAARLLQAGVDVNGDVASGGMTPLMIAQSPAMVSALLHNGADPNRRDVKGATALHHLLFAEQAEEMLPLLLAAGASVDAVAPGANNETPLLAARQLFFEGGDQDRAERIVRLLQRAGASVDAQDADGYTVLITASVNDKRRLAQLMLFLGAEPHMRTKDGMTALAWARQLGHREIEAMLLRHGARE